MLLRACIFSIRKISDENTVVGTGFVVDERHALTCAQVIEAAGGRPGDIISLVFADRVQINSARVLSEFYRGRDHGDVAVLRLLESLPKGVEPAKLALAADITNTQFQGLGYTSKEGNQPESRVWGEIERLINNGDLLELKAQQIDNRFSGAPVFDEAQERVVGMIKEVTGKKAFGNLDSAIAIPMQVVIKIWPELRLTDLPTNLVEIREGSFQMGSPLDIAGVHPNEDPQHKQDLPAFYIGRYPVTNAEYANFVSETAHPPPVHWKNGEVPPERLDHPVVNVNFDDAQAYCRWLSQKTGHPFRLPLETEWEKAARGVVDARVYTWGDKWAAYRCNSREDGRPDTTPVTAYEMEQENPYGVSDMIGNVWEWTASWYDKYPGSSHHSLKYGRIYLVVRGGSYQHDKYACRISRRGRYKPEVRRAYLGFRLASDARPPTILPRPQITNVSAMDPQMPEIGKRSQLMHSDVDKDMPLQNREFRQKLAKHFSRSELKNLMFDLDLNVDNFPNRADEMARELIEASRRHGLLQELLALVQRERPRVHWEEGISNDAQ